MRNAWYVAATSEQVNEATILERTLLSEPILLYRDTQGAVHALTNRCAHRGALLSDGELQGDCVMCPFHGWTYDGDGKCTYIPANGQDAPIPPNARVKSYPVAEVAGYVWVYMGDPEQQEERFVPEALIDPSWRLVPFELHWNAHLTRVVENTLDVSHLPFVHKSNSGDVDPIVDGPAFEVWEKKIRIEAKPYHPLVKTPLNQEERGVSIIEFWYPNQLLLSTEMFEGKQMATYLSITPVDDERVIIYGLALRNFFVDVEMVDEIHYDHNVRTLAEDQRVVEKLRPIHAPLDPRQEVHVRSDAPQVRYRMMVRRMLEQEQQRSE